MRLGGKSIIRSPHALLILLALRLPACGQEDRSFKLAESAREFLRERNWDRGLDLLREADDIASKGMSVGGFDGIGELSADRVAFGKEQVRKMLADRPNMAAQVGENDAICQWAARQFAGESTLNRVYWSSRHPTRANALHYPPTRERPGEILIALTDGVRMLPFEALWSCAIFELNNIANAPGFIAINARMLEGSIGRDEYVREHFRLEFLAAAKTRRFYLSIFAYRLQMERLDTQPELWFFTDAFLGDWRRGLQFYDNRSWYPWSAYGPYYDAYAPRRVATE